MKQYIEKDRILAEIDKRMEELRPTNTHKMQTGEKVDRDVLMWLNALTWVKKILGTLEVKEGTETKLLPSKQQLKALKDLLDYNIGVFDYQKFMEVYSFYNDLIKYNNYGTD